MRNSVTVHALGEFTVHIDGRPVERWRAGKAQSLLQFMLLRPGQVVSRDSLHDALWPADNRPGNPSSLKVAVHALRQILHRSHSSTPLLRLITRPPGYLLDVQGAWIDFHVFDELVSQGHTAQNGGAHDQAMNLYRSAIGHYGGEFLPGVQNDWAVTHREWLRNRVLWTLERLTGEAMRTGDDLDVMGWCQRMLEVEPLREQTYRTMIMLHARHGRLDQVRRWYDLCSVRLHEQLQVEPDPRTVQLYADAMRGRLVRDRGRRPR